MIPHWAHPVQGEGQPPIVPVAYVAFQIADEFAHGLKLLAMVRVEDITIIRMIIYNRIKTRLKPKKRLCFGKRSCMCNYDYRQKLCFLMRKP